MAGELAIPFGYVRCQAKGHGMKRSIEGYQQKDASVLIVEDVISRGTALNQALDGIGEHFKPLGALCLFDYGFAATKRRLDQRKLPVWSLVSFDDLIHAAHRHGLVDQAGLKRLQRHWEEAM